ncbi:uncharacterized protein LOC123268148 isoform X2 [Cotesia glomerata]|nr:uncharacterized protein LOC123268148 isoform X2 [Cotesia glomerata]
MGLLPERSPRHSIAKKPDNKENESPKKAREVNITPVKKIIPMPSQTKQVILQSKEGPQILGMLKGIHQILQSLDSKVTAQNQKIDDNVQRLKDLEQTVKTFQLTAPSTVFQKPAFIPFKNFKELKKYDKCSEEEREKLRKWLDSFNRRTNVTENVREILRGNRLMTDDLLTDVVWEGQNGRKSSKKQIFRLRITYDLRHALQNMYPKMTDEEYKLATQKALKAAYSRVDQRKRKTVNGENNAKKKRLSDAEFFQNAWAPGSDNEEEEEEEEVRNEDGKNEDKGNEDENGGGGQSS